MTEGKEGCNLLGSHYLTWESSAEGVCPFIQQMLEHLHAPQTILFFLFKLDGELSNFRYSLKNEPF